MELIGKLIMFTAHLLEHLCTIKVAEHFTRFFLSFFRTFDFGEGSLT